MRNTTLIALTFALNACVSPGDILTYKSVAVNDPRYSYAMQLEQQQQLADALVQWRILVLLYPDNPQIKNHIANLTQQIEKRVSALEQNIVRLGTSDSSSKQRRNLQLKILALKPNDQSALANLQRTNSKHELARALRKAQPVKLIVKKDNEESETDSDTLNDMLAVAEQQNTNGNFEQLLLSASAIEDIAPQHLSLKRYRYAAWNGLAQQKLNHNQVAAGLQCYEKAIRFADDADKKRLNQTISQIRQQESERLYSEAMKVFTSNITLSINLLEQAISIDGTNQRANQQLLRAETISKNLNLIKKNQRTN